MWRGKKQTKQIKNKNDGKSGIVQEMKDSKTFKQHDAIYTA